MCGGMLYLYSCCSVKLNRIEPNDELKIVIKFNPFYPFEYLIKSIPHRTVEESKNNKNGFEGFQERTDATQSPRVLCNAQQNNHSNTNEN